MLSKLFYLATPIFVVPLHGVGRLPKFSQIFINYFGASIKSGKATGFKIKAEKGLFVNKGGPIGVGSKLCRGFFRKRPSSSCSDRGVRPCSRRTTPPPCCRASAGPPLSSPAREQAPRCRATPLPHLPQFHLLSLCSP